MEFYQNATSRTRGPAPASKGSGPGLSVRQGNRVPLGEISVNTKSSQIQPQGPQKTQTFTVFEDHQEVKKPQGPAQHKPMVQNENASSSKVVSAQLPAKFTAWPAPPQIHDAKFWPPPPPIPKRNTHLPFKIHPDDEPEYDEESGSESEQDLSKSGTKPAKSSSSSSVDNDDVENLIPKIPSYVRSGFRQSNDESLLSTSPNSPNCYDDEDSPLVHAALTSDNARLDASEVFFDVEEYALDIVANTKKAESKFLPKWNYMTKQPDITFNMRSILVDWLVEVTEEYRLQTETLFLAVNYLDRFLSFMAVQKAKLQLVGTSCLFIASKYEEIYPPQVSEFCYITDDTYNKKQVFRMEHMILEILAFECSPPTAHFFANHFSKISGSSDESEAKYLAQYLAELTLLEAETYLHFSPSVIGAASVALARHTLGLPAWDWSMSEKTGYQISDFQECLVSLHETFTNAPQYPQQAIREKYKQDKFQRVSLLQPTSIY